MNKLIFIYIIITLILMILSIYTNRQSYEWRTWKYITLPIICIFWFPYMILVTISLFFRIDFIDKILRFIDRIS